MYVGVIALVLAAMAMFLRRRRPEVRAFSAIVILCLALVFVPPVAFVAGRLPLIGHVGLASGVDAPFTCRSPCSPVTGSISSSVLPELAKRAVDSAWDLPLPRWV